MSAIFEPFPAAGQRREPDMRHFTAVVIAALAAASAFSALAAEGHKPARPTTYVQIELAGQTAAAGRPTKILVAPANRRVVQ